MISLTRTDLVRYHVVCHKADQQSVIDLFSAGPNSDHGVFCESGPGESPYNPGIVSYVLLVHRDDAVSIRRVEGLRGAP